MILSPSQNLSPTIWDSKMFSRGQLQPKEMILAYTAELIHSLREECSVLILTQEKKSETNPGFNFRSLNQTMMKVIKILTDTEL